MKQVKIGGERLYKAARRGEAVERPARPVTVYEFRLERGGGRGRDVQFRIACSKGTYIRSLAHDLVRYQVRTVRTLASCRSAPEEAEDMTGCSRLWCSTFPGHKPRCACRGLHVEGIYSCMMGPITLGRQPL